MAGSKRKAAKKKAASRPARKRSTRSASSAAAPQDGIDQGQTAHSLSDDVVESALATGEFSGILEDYFGPQQYEDLRQLAREASTRVVRGGPRVLILPGIMGSKIGRKRKLLGLFDDAYWIDPIDVAAGHLQRLALPRGKDLKALGVILLAYLKLKLKLRIAGFDARFHAFDWRRSIDELGLELKAELEKLEKDGGRSVALVAHSMGGLVSRAAIAKGAPFDRLIMLGTPNFGSFVPIMALRATYPIVRKVGFLDTKHSPEQLCRDVFATFPGLVQMLPFPDHFDGLDLYDLANWPGTDGLAPRRDVLADAKRVQKQLAPDRDAFFLIAGVDQKTATGARIEEVENRKEFVYEFSNEGDGTVPLALARLTDPKRTWYVREGHGSLPNNGAVAQAVIDLLLRGDTEALPREWRPGAQRAIERVPESQLRAEPYSGRRAGLLSQSELRHLLDEVAAPDTRGAVPPVAAPGRPQPAVGPGFGHAFENVVVGRRRQHRIELTFAFGSITEASVRAIALGAFSEVTPTGAAAALDRRLGGAITDVFRRRMFAARIGEVFVLPRGRHDLRADFITFVGLGPFDTFTDQALQTAAENIIRTFINARIEEFATVLFGGSSGESPAGALQNLLTGFFRGLKDADHRHSFRRIVVCEQDRERYLALKAELFRLSSTALCHDVEMTFEEEVLDPPPQVIAPDQRAVSAVRRVDPVYLIVRQERTNPDTNEIDIRSALLTAGAKAAIITGVCRVKSPALEALREEITTAAGDHFAELGLRLSKMVLAEQVLQILPRYNRHHVVVVHDAAMSRVPWEVLAVEQDAANRAVWFPSAGADGAETHEGGLSHRYAADNLSVAKWLEDRIKDGVLNMLLVVNPTGDLEGANREGARILDLFAGRRDARIDELRGRAASHTAVLDAFRSGRYDVVHYAGHAFFDPRNPERSGLLCAGGVPLTGAQLASLGSLPTLVFFNACEAARIRTATPARAARTRSAKKKSDADIVARTVSFAEAFMRGGVANFLGTYWPVGDEPAKHFADTFYTKLLEGASLNDALLAGRRRVREEDEKARFPSRDWADYVFYGSPDFALKQAT